MEHKDQVISRATNTIASLLFPRELSLSFAQEASTTTNDTSTPTPAIIRLEKLKKHYAMGRTTLPVLYGLNLEIKRGEMVAIMGPSGFGKSTLIFSTACQ